MGRSIITKENFVSRASEKHNLFYNYDKVVISTHKCKVIITCPVHGDFYQNYQKHYAGHTCRKCSMIKNYATRKSLKFSTEHWVKLAKLKHGEKYDYSLVDYTGTNVKVAIQCKIHGLFYQKPKTHLITKGCGKCGRETFSKKTRNKYNIEDLKKSLCVVHNNKYDYSQLDLSNYITSKSEVKIICPVHGLFEQSLQSHQYGNGCNQCRFFGYTKTRYVDNCSDKGHETSEYYILRFYNEEESFIKLGITVQGIRTRFKRVKDYKYEILYSKKDEPQKVWDIERKNKSKYLSYKYIPNLKFPGFSECFTTSLPIQEVIASLN